MRIMINYQLVILLSCLLFLGFSTEDARSETVCSATCSEEALLYAGISDAVYNYESYTLNNETWTIVKRYNWGAGCNIAQQIFGACTFSGFDAALYTNDSEDKYILAFRGTEHASDPSRHPMALLADLQGTVGEAIGAESWQYKQAINIASQFASYSNIVLTGHSLGGGLAIAASLETGLPAYVFDPSPLRQDLYNKTNNKIKIYRLANYYGTKFEFIKQIRLDLLLKLMWSESFWEPSYAYGGEIFNVYTPQNWYGLSPFDLHSIDNMIRVFKKNQPVVQQIVYQYPTFTSPGGSTFHQIAEGFTPNGQGTIKYRREGTGDADIHHHDFMFDNTGKKEFLYQPSSDKPYGKYEWWIVDNSTQVESEHVVYHIVQPNNQAYIFGFEASEKTPTDSPPPECLPDFVAKRAWITKSEHGNDKYIFEPGDTPWINVKVKNEGCADSPQDIHVWYFLSHGEHEDSHSDWVKIGDDKIRKNELHVGQDKWEKEEFDVPTEPGVYNIVACADRISKKHNGHGEVIEEHKSNDCSTEAVFTVFPKNNLPVGTFETATCSGLKGWTRDPDSTTGISVNFYADGPSGNGTFLGTTMAIVTRNDLGGDNREHGFSFEIPESLRNGTTHQIYAYGVDSLNGTESLLSGSPKAINCSNPTYPDLIVPSISVNHPYVTPNQAFIISSTVRNQGNGSSASTILRYYRSTDSTISTGDTELATDSVSALPANGTSAENITVTAPPTAGTFWIGTCVDTVGNESNISNNCSTGIPVTVSNTIQPDLVITSLQVTSFTSGRIQYSYTIKNVGTGPANLDGPTSAEHDNVSIQAFLSSDNIFNNVGDIAAGGSILGLSPLGELTPGETYTGSYSASYPADIAATPYITIKIDYGDVVNESNESNNTAAVLINETHPDLAVEITNLTEVTLAPGQSFTANATLRNQGNTPSNNTSVHYYRSTDSTITSSDTQVSIHQVSSLQPGGLFSDNTSLTAPNTPGSYWIGACVDSASSESNTGNNCSSGVQITVNSATHPDLVVQSPSVSSSMLTPGQLFTTGAIVRNQGDGYFSSMSYLRYYLSSDQIISANDALLSIDSVMSLSPNETSEESNPATAPNTNGTYWIGACIDAVDGESNTTNNCSTAVKITVGNNQTDKISMSPIINLLLQSAVSRFRADVNGNGVINTFDANLIYRFVSGSDMSQTGWIVTPQTGDVNCSGIVDNHDVDLVMRYSLGLEMTSTDWCVK